MLLRWVKEAWESLTSEIIVRSFKKTGISNMLDGTEDDDLWQLSNSDEDDDELEFPGTIPKQFFFYDLLILLIFTSLKTNNEVKHFFFLSFFFFFFFFFCILLHNYSSLKFVH